MKTVVYTCPYVPAEWIAAHGLCPRRSLLDSVDSGVSRSRREGVCPYVRSFIGEVTENSEADAVVMTTVCDQMRRAFDVIARNCALPAFLMNVPSMWQTLASQKLYVDELKRLSRFLVERGGKAPSNNMLAEIMIQYDEVRTSIRASREYLSARRFAEAIAENRVCNEPALSVSNGLRTLHDREGIPLAIVGGPLMKADFDLLDMIEQLGGRVVLDASETGERGMCPEFDRGRLADDPLLELAHAYFGGIPDASRRPDGELYRWLKCELTGRTVRGIVFRRYVWCDLWHAELARLKEWCGLPVLDLDAAGENGADLPRTSNRIRAFLEMLQ